MISLNEIVRVQKSRLSNSSMREMLITMPSFAERGKSREAIILRFANVR